LINMGDEKPSAREAKSERTQDEGPERRDRAIRDEAPSGEDNKADEKAGKSTRPTPSSSA
jgi:hypothetical protein